MKRKIVILILMILLCIDTIFANSLIKKADNTTLTLASEYTQYNEFDLNKIPNRFFYKLNTNCKYYIYSKDDILSIYQNDKGGILINYNKNSLDLTYDNGDSYTSIDTSIYIIREENNFYLFVDKLHFNDNKSYGFYQLTNKSIDLILAESGLISFVGYDYVVGYTSLGIIGYQISEFKKVFKYNKLELDGEYRIVGSYDGYPTFPIWKLYKLVKDLEYDEYDSNNKKYNKKTLKIGTKIRALSTDAQTYILIETEKGDIGKIKIDKVDCDNRDFYVNDKVFMNYYFLDGSKDSIEVFCPMFSY